MRIGFMCIAAAAGMTRSEVKMSMLCRLSRAGSLSKPPPASGATPSGPPAAAGSPPIDITTQRTAGLEVGLSTVSISGGAIPPPFRGPGAPVPAGVQQPGFNMGISAMAAANASHAAANGGPAAGGAQQDPQEAAAAPVLSAAAQPAVTMSRAASLLDEPQEPLALGTDGAAQAGSPAGEQQPQQQDAAAPQGPADQPASPTAATLTIEQPAAAQADPAAARSAPAVSPGPGQAAEGVAQPGAGPSGSAQGQPSANGVTPGLQAAAGPAAGQGSPPTAGGAQAAPAAATAAAVPVPPARAAPPPLPPLEKGDMLEAFRCCSNLCTRRCRASNRVLQSCCRRSQE